MALMQKKSRSGGDIPTSSMADIAFLLLIFFLVTTIFDEERGLPIVLPEPQEEVEVSQRNILHLAIQPSGIVVVRRGESTAESVHQPREIEALWRMEYAQNDNLIAAVKTHPEAAYRHMIAVLDQLHLAGATRISLQVLE